MSSEEKIVTSEILSVEGIEVIYDESILGVADISLKVLKGEIVAILGANGAGKSTTMKAISGIAVTERARVSKGDIKFKNKSVLDIAPHKLAHKNIVHVLEGRRVFEHLTVEENLKSGTFLHRPTRAQMNSEMDQIYHWFPRLKDKRKTLAGLTSGGEQQMLAIGRALLTKPELVLLDEPSMGLAPILMQEIFSIISQLNKENNVSFLVAEQNIHLSLRHAHRAYLIESGKVALSGTAEELSAREDLHQIYLGVETEV